MRNKIVDIKSHKEIIYCLFDLHSYFEVAIQDGNITDEIRDFMLEDLSGCYETFQELRKDIENIVIPEHPWSRKSSNFSEKIIAFLYSNMISFCRTEKLNDIPLSKKFINNIKNVMENTHCVHHSHIFSEIIGYSHTSSNEKVREHYYRMPVTAHNLFRLFSLFFFFLLKGLRTSVWRTRDIVIGNKNPTDINFASIGNQVQFLETIKYFQQSLDALADSLTEWEKKSYQ